MAYYKIRKPDYVLSLHTMCRHLSCKRLAVGFIVYFTAAKHPLLKGNSKSQL